MSWLLSYTQYNELLYIAVVWSELSSEVIDGNSNGSATMAGVHLRVMLLLGLVHYSTPFLAQQNSAY